MVYCGKPSKACAECRLRRTKCDAKQPSCSQCIRARRTCNGYRDLGDMMFRDQSANMSLKHQRLKKTHKAHLVPPTDTSSKPSAIPAQSLIEPVSRPLIPPPTFSPSFGLAVSAEFQATCFFFQNYVLQKDCLYGGNFQYLSDIYGSEKIGSALTDTVASLGMAGLAHLWQASSIMMRANFKYTSAVSKISRHLRVIEEAKSDQVLISTMLLSLYETNTCYSYRSIESWTKHLLGATALMQLRGKNKLQTPIGYNLFVQLRTQIITNCIQRQVAIPPIIEEWSRDIDFDFETPEQKSSGTLANLAIKYCNLRASMSCFRDYSNPERIITAACAIDDEIEEWTKTCPKEFMYDTVLLKEKTDEVFSDYIHIYSSIWIATTWNHYRTCRLLINELILDQLNNCDPSSLDTSSPLWKDDRFRDNQILKSNVTLLQLRHDICASAPFFLGFDPAIPNLTERPTPQAVNGNLLLWPLYGAGLTGMASDIMRNWVIGRLLYITDVMGIRQAAPLAATLSSGQDIVEWKAEHEMVEYTPADTEISLRSRC